MEVKHSEAANIADAVDMDSELAEKVDDGPRTWREGEPENERCKDNRYELLSKDNDFEREELAELRMNLQSVKAFYALAFWEWSCPSHSLGR